MLPIACQWGSYKELHLMQDEAFCCRFLFVRSLTTTLLVSVDKASRTNKMASAKSRFYFIPRDLFLSLGRIFKVQA